ncbi:MAG: GTPase Era [Chloroflexi bacterium]|nr:GTPase Era [Chloroflexota bacterium]
MSELDSVFSDDWGEDHRSGLVAVVGRPNVGKSTLINAILGQKIAIVTAKPQTTRRRQLGIYTNEEAQVLFIDTPGIHKPRSVLGKYMVGVAHDALKDADVILWILDASAPPTAGDQNIAALLGRIVPATPRVLALNKIDLAGDSAEFAAHASLCEHQSALPVSAKEARGISDLIASLIPLLPRGPRYYPAGQASEANLRFLAAEIIRERIIELTSDELPHAVAVEITRFREKRYGAQIEASIFVERGSQKGIVIGKRGDLIKRIGVESRVALEALLESRVNLETRVKVQKNWRSNAEFLRRIGYPLPKRGRN